MVGPIARIACVMVSLGQAATAWGQEPAAERGGEIIREAQAAAREAAERDLASVVPLKIQVVLSRYEGSKKISTTPYEMAVRTDGANGAIRMATRIAVPNLWIAPPAPETEEGASGPPVRPPNPPVTSFTYQEVGTNIGCQARRLNNGRFSVTISIEDRSVYPPDQPLQSRPQGVDAPAFRTYESSNALILRDGQSAQFTVATDKITGEVIKADVTMTVLE